VTRCRSWWIAAAGLGVCLTVVTPLDAASFTLTTAGRSAAVTAGRRSVITEDFGAEWTVKGDAPGQTVTVMTPFHRLALAARNSAFKNEELRPKDVETLLRDERGTLTLWATLTGDRADFARFYTPVLATGGHEIKASFAQNERTARREEDGRYTARCLYVFPAEGLKPDDRLTLIVKDSADKPVARFTVDLAAMR
jgi:hypothetical protein